MRLWGSTGGPTPLPQEKIKRSPSTSGTFGGKWSFPETKGTEVRQSFVIEGNDWRERVTRRHPGWHRRGPDGLRRLGTLAVTGGLGSIVLLLAHLAFAHLAVLDDAHDIDHCLVRRR